MGGLAHVVESLVSKGSMFHGSGECKPCAWFYKPQGCQNGAECLHCHLCPENEIQARRRAKRTRLQAKQAIVSEIDAETTDEGESVVVSAEDSDSDDSSKPMATMMPADAQSQVVLSD